MLRRKRRKKKVRNTTYNINCSIVIVLAVCLSVCSKNCCQLRIIIAYSISFSIIRFFFLCSFALRSQRITSSSIHSYNSFIHPFIHSFIHSLIGGTMHTCHLRHTHDIVQSYLLLLFFFFFFVFSCLVFYSFVFFSYLCAYVCSIVIENLYKTRINIYIYIANTHTNIVTSTYMSIIFYHLLFLKYLSRFYSLILYTISFLLLSMHHDR